MNTPIVGHSQPLLRPTEQRLQELEAAMLQLPQATCNVRHIFGPGLYIRELTVPADTFVVGHWQKTVHMNVMIKGRVTVMNDDGSTTELVAPLTFVGQPGRKVGYVSEEMVWQNIYATDEVDVDKLEAMFLDKSAAYNANVPQIEQTASADYDAMLAEVGVTNAVVQAQSENEADQIPFPPGAYKVKVGQSRIHGRGLVATADITAGEIICPARISGKRTPAGRFTNHAKQPNAVMQAIGNDIYLQAVRQIAGCRGGQDGEEITVDYRESVKVTLELSQCLE